MGSTWAREHEHEINMGTGTRAWDQQGHQDSTMQQLLTWAQHETMQQLLDSQGSGGGAPGKLETRCCRNEVSEAHLRAEGTGRKLVSIYEKETAFCLLTNLT